MDEGENNATMREIEENAESTGPEWEMVRRGKHSHVWIRKMKGQPFDGVRTRCNFTVPAPLVVEYFLDTAFRQKWDSNFHSSKVLEQIDDSTTIWHMSFKTPVRLIRPRDVVIRMTTHCVEGHYTIEYHSVIHPLCPPQEGVVRAEIMRGSGAVIIPLDSLDQQSPSLQSAMCQATQVEYLDYKGKVPMWLVNQVSARLANSFDKFRKKAEKRFRAISTKRDASEGIVVDHQVAVGPFPGRSSTLSSPVASPSPMS